MSTNISEAAYPLILLDTVRDQPHGGTLLSLVGCYEPDHESKTEVLRGFWTM